MVTSKILDNWYKDFKGEFDNRQEFDKFVASLKESDI
jgi:hypothetical protein